MDFQFCFLPDYMSSTPDEFLALGLLINFDKETRLLLPTALLLLTTNVYVFIKSPMIKFFFLVFWDFLLLICYSSFPNGSSFSHDKILNY